MHLHLGVLRTFKSALLPEPLQWEESDYGLSTGTQSMGGRSWMFEEKWSQSVDSGNEELVGVRCNLWKFTCLSLPRTASSLLF